MPTPRRPVHQRPFRRALILSLALHAALGVWLLRSERTRRRPPPPRPAMRVSIRPLPPRPTRPERPASPPAPAHPHLSVSSASPVPALPRPGVAGEAPAEGSPPSPGAAAARTPGADAPLQLFPGGAVARGAGPVPPGDGASTSRDVPESREAEGRRVQQRVDTWRWDSLAERRVATGVDDYFKDFRRAMQANMGPPPPGGGPKHGDLTAGQRWINAWLDALEDADPSKEPPPPGERMPARDVQDVTGRMDEFIGNHLGPMAVQPSFAAQRLLRRASAGLPVAVLRIVQRADGSIASTELVASSGDKTFDAYVVEHAALALAAVPRPPARQGAGLHPDGTRTEWAFYRAEGSCGVLLLRVY